MADVSPDATLPFRDTITGLELLPLVDGVDQVDTRVRRHDFERGVRLSELVVERNPARSSAEVDLHPGTEGRKRRRCGRFTKTGYPTTSGPPAARAALSTSTRFKARFAASKPTFVPCA